MNPKPEKRQWRTSSEVRKCLKISTCELAHRRDNGQLRFKKKGNSYLYLLDQSDQAATSPIENAVERPNQKQMTKTEFRPEDGSMNSN